MQNRKQNDGALGEISSYNNRTTGCRYSARFRSVCPPGTNPGIRAGYTQPELAT